MQIWVAVNSQTAWRKHQRPHTGFHQQGLCGKGPRAQLPDHTHDKRSLPDSTHWQSSGKRTCCPRFSEWNVWQEGAANWQNSCFGVCSLPCVSNTPGPGGWGINQGSFKPPGAQNLRGLRGRLAIVSAENISCFQLAQIVTLINWQDLDWGWAWQQCLRASDPINRNLCHEFGNVFFALRSSQRQTLFDTSLSESPQAASLALLIPVCFFTKAKTLISYSKSTFSKRILTRTHLSSCCRHVVITAVADNSAGADNVCTTPLFKTFFSLGPWGLMVGTKNLAGTTNRRQQTQQDQSRTHGMVVCFWQKSSKH